MRSYKPSLEIRVTTMEVDTPYTKITVEKIRLRICQNLNRPIKGKRTISLFALRIDQPIARQLIGIQINAQMISSPYIDSCVQISAKLHESRSRRIFQPRIQHRHQVASQRGIIGIKCKQRTFSHIRQIAGKYD